jgi:hypothetical protein
LHVVFYGPYMTNADLGSDGNLTGPAFVAGESTPHALIIVPVGGHAGQASSDNPLRLAGSNPVRKACPPPRPSNVYNSK